MTSTGGAPRVVVVGGGITGLAAAHRLLASVPEDRRPRVTVLETQPRLGGKIRTTPFAGLPGVDEGPDAFLARVPWATAFARRLGLDDELTSPASASAAVWWDGLQPIPEGLLLGLPTDIGKLARTKLLSWGAKLRAATEPLRPRTDLAPDSVGAYVRARFGDQVHERLVDPLVGSIYAADTDRFSLAAVPQLAALAAGPRSVLLGSRHPAPAAPGPVFAVPEAGMGRLVDAAAAAVGELGGTIRTGSPCSTLERDGDRWRLDGEQADGVILACPAAQAARLLAGSVAAEGLASIEYADVVLITVAVPAASWPDRLAGMSGYLVPKPVQGMVTACSFGSQKWAHWRTPDSVVLRISLGRDGLPVLHLSEEQMIAAALDETGRHIGVDLQPTEIRVTPWQRAFPQYRPHHSRLVAGIEDELPPSLVLAGASYHGIGVPACIHSGQRAAEALSAHFGTPLG